MARPKKSTVDYFPHVTNHGKTMYILEGKFGNDGYAVFFKILEQLGKTDGHFIDCNDQTTWEFLTAYCRISGDLLREILDLCAKLGAIDPDFWQDNFIFSQNFIDGVKEAYRQRKIDIPDRNAVSTVINSHKARISTVINPQMKVNEMKVNEIIKTSSSTDMVINGQGQKAMMGISEFRFAFYDAFGSVMPGGCNEQASALCREFTPARINEAFTIAAAQGVTTLAYVEGVLRGNGKNKRGRHVAERDMILGANAQACRDFIEASV